MAYFAPYIDAAGLHIPTYTDIRDDLIAEFKRIYGQNIYLDNDSQDYQMISAFALKTYDTIQLLQIIYNNHSPKTAVGSGLDNLVKLNGIKRKMASYSTCVVTIAGEVGTTITNGVIEDDAGHKWSLPTTVKLSAREQDVTAQCDDIGAIEAVPGSIVKISTPTKGWLSVTNKVAAVTGAPVETSEALRLRQSISVANPSRNMLDGAIGGIASIEGVKRYKIYENDSSITDDKGIPGHSIAAVVEGGLDESIAKELYLRKGPGCGTYGTTQIAYTSEDGLVNNIQFFRPEYKNIDVSLTVKRLSIFDDRLIVSITENIKFYLKRLGIGSAVTITGLLASILSLLKDISKPDFYVADVKLGLADMSLSNNDIQIPFNAVASAGNISVEVI